MISNHSFEADVYAAAQLQRYSSACAQVSAEEFKDTHVTRDDTDAR
jgi:hypothetical protein